MAEKIFVSYSHKDRLLVKGLEERLRQHGIVTAEDVVIFDPQSKFKPGDNVREAIKKQMMDASKVVIIASDTSAESQLMNYEAGMATALGKPIVVFRRKGAKRSSFQNALGNIQAFTIDEIG